MHHYKILEKKVACVSHARRASKDGTGGRLPPMGKGKDELGATSGECIGVVPSATKGSMSPWVGAKVG